MQNCSCVSVIFVILLAYLQIQRSFLTKTQNHAPAKSTKRACITSNAIHLPGSLILHHVCFRYPIGRQSYYKAYSSSI
jgi:hypothetical protein